MGSYPRTARNTAVQCVPCNAPAVETLDGDYVCVECGARRVRPAGGDHRGEAVDSPDADNEEIAARLGDGIENPAACYAFPGEDESINDYLFNTGPDSQVKGCVERLKERCRFGVFSSDRPWYEVDPVDRYLNPVCWAFEGDAIVHPEATLTGTALGENEHMMAQAEVGDSRIEDTVAFPDVTLANRIYPNPAVDQEARVENVDHTNTYAGEYTDLTKRFATTEPGKGDASNPYVQPLLLGVFVFATTLLTILVTLPVGVGYLTFSAATIYLAAFLFGGKFAGIVGGIGVAAGDILMGYAGLAPFSIVVRGIEGFVVGEASGESLGSKLRAVMLGTPIVLGGYFVAATYLADPASGLIQQVPITAAQVLVGAAAAIPIAQVCQQSFPMLETKWGVIGRRPDYARRDRG